MGTIRKLACVTAAFPERRNQRECLRVAVVNHVLCINYPCIKNHFSVTTADVTRREERKKLDSV